MIMRRLRVSLKGWGGVGAMALACALAVVLALLLPLTQPDPEDGAGLGGRGIAQGVQAKAGDCGAHPEDLSPAPSGDESGTTIQKIKKRGYLTVGVDQNSYRWGYRDPNSTKENVELEGFDIDLARRIAEEILGSPDDIRFRAIPTDQRIEAIQDGRVDMVVRTMTISCKRLEQVAFSAPYFVTGQQVLAPETSDIKGYDKSLAGKKVCTAQGSTANEKLADDKESGKLPASVDISETVPNQLDCLVRLQLGEADAVVTDGALAASQAAQDPTVQLKGETFTTEYYGVAMKKDAGDLVRRVNRVLEDYRKDGWQKSYDRWLAATLPEDSPSSSAPAAHYK
ncbi:glutamate ABC transporter substrate-binding protein [Streptomyces sp. NPDC059785]|uniref:glutamate ABC transporter substrate-binding protein n=1 Tax=unclassified Streptomyces TaxID=2593676 RepID=UPI00365A7A91